MISFLTKLLIFFEDEGDSHVGLVDRNLVVLDHDVHVVLDPCTLDVAQGAGGAVDTLVDGILKALIRCGA
jgi:hypothetical protein